MTPADGRCRAAVLAAGLGVRMRSSTPKVLHPLIGRPMLGYVLDAAREATEADPIVVYSPASAAVCETFAGAAEFALQAEPLGTGDAVRAALTALPDGTAELLVVYGDVPLVDPALLAALIRARRDTDAAIALVTVAAAQPAGLGRIVRDGAGERVLRIVEEKDATGPERELDEINAGIYAFDAAWLRRRIADLTPSAATGELYLTELVELAAADGRDVRAVVAPDDGSLSGINDRVQLAAAAAELRARVNRRHMVAGVTMEDPATAYVEATVELAADVVLEPNVVLQGRTRIGAGTRIAAGSQIRDSLIGERCRIWASVLESSEVEDDVQIGPFSHLRPGASIGRGARLGNYAEVKGSRLGPGVQQHHFSYIGDAELGERTNVGAGTITCNYDGQRKHRTTIGKRVFLGSDTMLVAPLEIGDGAKTGAGSVVTRDVPAGMLAVGVPARLRTPRGARPSDVPPASADSSADTSAEASADGASDDGPPADASSS